MNSSLSLEVLGQEPMQIRKNDLGTTDGRKGLQTPPRSTQKKTIPAVFKATLENLFGNKRPVQTTHLTENTTTESNYDPMPPHVIKQQSLTHSPKVNKRYLMSTSPIIWRKKGYIVASSSRYGSPTFTVKKKDGSLRIVHDYRKLNEIYSPRCYPPAKNIVNPRRTPRKVIIQ